MRLTQSQRRGWLTYIAALRRELPTRAKVRTRRTPNREAANAFHHSDGTHEINIGNHLNFQERLDALEHEWAHCLDMDANGDRKKEHRQSWGKHFARVHSVIEATSERLENG